MPAPRPLSVNAPCRCDSGRKAKSCCAPVLAGALAATPEALMRSRYVAWATGDVAHLMRTTAPESPHHGADARAWAQALRDAAAAVTFTRLHVDAASHDGDTGEVAFRAEALRDGAPEIWAERSRFVRRDGVWRYVDGAPHP